MLSNLERVSLGDVVAAAERIKPHAHRTPVMTSRTVDGLAGRQVFFKCEHLQRCGAFKFRGALNAVLSLSEDDAVRGVVTDSSGNHGQSLAAAAAIRGIPSTIVMPADAPLVKQAAVRGYGGRVVLCEPTLASRQATVERVEAETGAVHVSSNHDPAIVAGQGTVALELLEQVEGLDAIVTPIGGGGLVSGTAIVASASRVRTIGGEPSGADDAAQSMRLGQQVFLTSPKTVAKGLLVNVGPPNWPVLRELVDRVLTVEDREILAAMHLVWERMKQVVEPSGVVGLAAVLSDAFRELDDVRRVGVVLSGGNVDLSDLPW